MKHFHHLGTLAATVFGVTGAVILWFYFSASSAPRYHASAGPAFQVWLGTAGLFWTWYLREEQRRANPTHFTDAIAFVEHLELHATFDGGEDVASTWLAPGRTPQAVLAVGGEGFNARLRRIDAAASSTSTSTSSRPDAPDATAPAGIRLTVQLLVPATALASLPVGATPRVLIEGGPIGAGEVLRLMPVATA
jgi:hypothetical protein